VTGPPKPDPVKRRLPAAFIFAEQPPSPPNSALMDWWATVHGQDHQR
jgi:hypothetical protein